MLIELKRNALSVYPSYCTDSGGKAYFEGGGGYHPLLQRQVKDKHTFKNLFIYNPLLNLVFSASVMPKSKG